LTDPTSVRKAVRMSKADIIVHTAAITPVRFSFDKPQQYAEVNYIGTINLIQAILEEKIKPRQIVHASTIEVYRSKNGLITEEDPLFGGTPYGISKVAADHYMQMAKIAYDLPITILRGSNTFGRPVSLPEEARGYLVEKAILQMLDPDKRVAEFDGWPDRKRTWLYAPDHVSGYLTVIDNDKAIGEIYNISQNNCTSVGDVVSLISEITGFKGEIRWGVKPRPYDPLCMCADGGKLMKLGWKAKYSLREGLEKTVFNFRKWLRRS